MRVWHHRRVRHRRFDLAALAVERVPVPLVLASLVVARPDGADDLQWEVVARAIDAAPFAEGRYLVDLTTLEGRYLRGEAVLVRSVEGTHVLRGDGPLHGLDPGELDASADDRR